MQLTLRHSVAAILLSSTAVLGFYRDAIGEFISSSAQEAMETDIPDDPRFGPEPRFSDCLEDADEYLRLVLKDYDSAKIEWESEGLEAGAFLFDDGEFYRVRYLSVLVNAKNGFGAYSGQRRWAFGWDGEELFGVSTDGGSTWTHCQ